MQSLVSSHQTALFIQPTTLVVDGIVVCESQPVWCEETRQNCQAHCSRCCGAGHISWTYIDI